MSAFTKQQMIRRIRNRLGTVEGNERYGKPFNKDELRQVAEFFDADVDDDDTKPEICAKLANASGLTTESSAEDYPHGLDEYDVRRLSSKVDDALDDDDE